MPFKHDSQQVKHFAFVPIGRGPDGHHAGRLRRRFGNSDLETKTLRASQRQQVIVHFKARLVGGSIAAAQICQKIELQRRVIAKEPADLEQPRAVDEHRRLALKKRHLVNGGAESIHDPFYRGAVFKLLRNDRHSI